MSTSTTQETEKAPLTLDKQYPHTFKALGEQLDKISKTHKTLNSVFTGMQHDSDPLYHVIMPEDDPTNQAERFVGTDLNKGIEEIVRRRIGSTFVYIEIDIGNEKILIAVSPKDINTTRNLSYQQESKPDLQVVWRPQDIYSTCG